MIGQRLGTFLIEAELGSGTMGTVYRAVRETGKTRIAAIKVIRAESMAKGKAFERFLREIEILKKLRHSNIVRYMAHGKSGKTYYYAMEYIRGPTLDTLLGDRGPLFWVDVVRYAIQICDALHYSHEHSVVHRDLKPSNLMVKLSTSGSTADDTIKLTDFGIAKDLDATALTLTGRTLGTANYMAPEQVRGTPEVSHKTDLYALGVVMYQMLTGELPFSGASVFIVMNCQVNDPPPRPSAKTQIIPVQLDKLVLKLMAKDPKDRPWDAAAVASTLRRLLAKREANEEIREVWTKEGTVVATPRMGVPLPNPKKKSRKKNRPKVSDRLTAALPELGWLLCLVAIGGLIVYNLWWPSAEYLYKNAKNLMASEWCDLQLMSAVNDVSGIPRAGKNLVIVAVVDRVLHFRIFAGNGEVVVDTDEKTLTEQTRQIEVLRTQLEGLWPPHEPTKSEKAPVIEAVTSIVDHIPSVDPTTGRRATEYLDDLDRWYPGHRYKSETEAWRDRIALSAARSRAKYIERSPFPEITKTTGQGEDLYAAVFRQVSAALKCDADAARLWREMAAQLEKEGAKSERGWRLLAKEKAAKIEATIADRAKLPNFILSFLLSFAVTVW